MANLDKNSPDLKRFWKEPTVLIMVIGLAIITLITIAFVLFTIIGSKELKAFSDLTETNSQEYLRLVGNLEEEYYVYIFRGDEFKHETLEEILILYANYVSQNKNARPLYVLNFGIDYEDVLKKALGYAEGDLTNKLPTLTLIKKGKLSNSKWNTVSTISTELQSQMN